MDGTGAIGHFRAVIAFDQEVEQGHTASGMGQDGKGNPGRFFYIQRVSR